MEEEEEEQEELAVKKIKEIASQINSGAIKKVIVMTGAGVCGRVERKSGRL